MHIRDIFDKDINRSINGVIKVQQSDEESVKQELSEYVVTRELQGHFAHFFESYARALDVPTDKIGVWISGFFGSGKSHFLKMLSYVLENGEVGGKRVIDYFDGKLKDPLVYENMRRCAEVPTEAMLFDIDAKGGKWKSGDTAETALLRAFERVFYENLGFCGENLKVAKLEQFVEKRGKTAEFRETFANVTGMDWLDARTDYDFYEDGMVEVLQKVLGMSEIAARHWYDGEEDDVIAIDSFVSQVNKYCEARAAENGGRFRLLFMADETGQFIGEGQSLMLNLQTLVEEFGARCGGRVWVMVTSQEAIDEVAMIVGDDFSKIQGRFNTRLSLSSSSVDEVIKRRVLEKTPAATLELANEYKKKSPTLKNLFTFEGSRGDLVGFDGQTDFCESYPFVNYQFKVLPDVMTEVRKHGVKAKHMSTGERSMLSAFQESAQALQEQQTTALVPFWRFFDTISKDLEHGIIQVITRAQDAADAGRGLKPEDVSLLKLLYLIRYIDYIKSTINNITILTADDMNVDTMGLRQQVTESLARLVRENYVARQGDTYNFLTDEEQDIAREISETSVDTAEVIESIKKSLFGGIYTQSKLACGANNFPIDRYVDNSLYGTAQHGMKLNVITLASDLGSATDGELTVKSVNQAIVVLDNDKDYYDVLLGVAKVRKYARTKNLAQLPPSTQQIIMGKQRQAAFDEKEATKLLEDAVAHARCFVNGNAVKVRATNAKGVIDDALERLAESVFSKAGYITDPVEGDGDIIRILRGTGQDGLEGFGGGNEKACAAVEEHLQLQERIHQQTTVGDVQRKFQAEPYGWREVDVAATVARLLAGQRAAVLFAGAPVACTDKEMVNYLRKNADKAEIKRRVKMNEALLKKCRDILGKFTGARDIPADEDGLVDRVKTELDNGIEQCQALMRQHYIGTRAYPYPFQQVIEDGLHAMTQVRDQQNDPEALLRAFKQAEGDLLDFAEDKKEYVDEFFSNQQRIFDESVALLESVAAEGTAMDVSEEAQQAIANVKKILQSEVPDVPRLSDLNKTIRKAHGEVVAAHRREFLDALAAELAGLQTYAEGQDEYPEAAADAFNQAKTSLESMKGTAHAAQTAQRIDALRFQLQQKATVAQRSIDAAVEAARQKAAREISVPHKTDDGSVVRNVYETAKPAAPKRQVKEVRRVQVCQRAMLETPAQVDEYLAALRTQLLESLEGNDAISLI